MPFQFQLSQKHLDYQNNVKEYLQTIDSSCELDILKSLAKEGYLNLPGEEGSKADDHISLVLTVEEVAKFYPKTANLMADVLFALATAKKHAPVDCQKSCVQKISTLELLITVLFSEPGNYEVDKLATTLEKTDSGYQLKGTKVYARENTHSDRFLVIANLVDGDSKQLVAVPVDKDKVNIIKKEMPYGNGTVSVELAEIDVQVEEGKALNIDGAMKAELVVWRNLVAASAIGLAHTNLVAALNVCRTTKDSSNMALTNQQAIQFTASDAFAEIEGARLVTYYSAALVDADTPSVRFSMIAKAQACEAAVVSSNKSSNMIGYVGNVYDEKYLEALQLAYNRSTKEGSERNSYNLIYQEALAKR